MQKEQDDITALQENLKKAEIANGLFPYFSDYQESIAKEKATRKKLPLLQNFD